MIRLLTLSFTTLLLMGCASGRLSHDEARRKVAEIGRSRLVPDAIEIRRIVSPGDNQAIAEASVTLAFEFVKDSHDEWRIASVRLGDRDWIDLDEFLAAINEGRRRETTEAMQKLVEAVARYRSRNGEIPAARDIVGLTDILHPLYIGELIRLDRWHNPIDYETAGPAGFRLVSRGPDGVRGTPDDIVLP